MAPWWFAPRRACGEPPSSIFIDPGGRQPRVRGTRRRAGPDRIRRAQPAARALTPRTRDGCHRRASPPAALAARAGAHARREPRRFDLAHQLAAAARGPARAHWSAHHENRHRPIGGSSLALMRCDRPRRTLPCALRASLSAAPAPRNCCTQRAFARDTKRRRARLEQYQIHQRATACSTSRRSGPSGRRRRAREHVTPSAFAGGRSGAVSLLPRVAARIIAMRRGMQGQHPDTPALPPPPRRLPCSGWLSFASRDTATLPPPPGAAAPRPNSSAPLSHPARGQVRTNSSAVAAGKKKRATAQELARAPRRGATDQPRGSAFDESSGSISGVIESSIPVGTSSPRRADLALAPRGNDGASISYRGHRFPRADLEIGQQLR